jgi:tetratricopeptide (TPR) repeat protein
MTVVLPDDQRLAAPNDWDFLSPPTFGGLHDPFLEPPTAPDDEKEQDDLHLRQARDLAERHTGSASAWARLAQAELIAGEREAAIGAAQASLKQMERPDRGAALAASIVLAACDRPELAEAALRRLDDTLGRTQAPLDDPLLVFRAGLAATHKDYATALGLLADAHSAEASGLRGWIFLAKHDYPAAIHAYREALRKGWVDPLVLTNIGYAHAALGNREKAIRDTAYALSLNPPQRTRVGLNLVGYYVSGGELDRALALLRSLQKEEPHEVDLWFAEAHLRLSAARPQEALRVLRRVRTSRWAHLSTTQQAELAANLAFLRWHLGKMSVGEAAREISHELERSEFASVRVAEMLPALMNRFSNAKVLKGILAKTHQATDAPLYYLEMHAAILERRFEEAVEISLTWVRCEPLNSSAATTATYLLTDIADDVAKAIEIGLPAVRKMPAVMPLANNVAYALALAGRPQEARRLVPHNPTAQATATRALIELRLGETDTALALYREAFERASKSGDPDLSALVALHARRALRCFGEGANEEDLGLPEIEPKPDWAEQPRFAIAARMLTRHGVELTFPVD